MKLFWSTIKAAVVAGGILVAGQAYAQETNSEDWSFVFGSGAVGGTFNIAITALVEKFKVDYPQVSVDVIPGGSLSNAIRLGRGDFPVAMITSLTAQQAYRGEGEPRLEEVGPLPEIRGVASIYNQHFQIVVPADFPADTMEEVIEQKMSVSIVPGGPRGHIGVQATNDLLRAAYGITLDDMEDWGARVIYAEFADATSMVQDGQVDLFMPLTAAPNGAVLDLANSRPIKILGISEEAQEKMKAAGYAVATLPAGTYPGQETEVPTISAPAGIYARSDADPAMIEALVKTLIKHAVQFKQAHVRLAQDFSLTTAPEGLGLPLHEGAEKAYREAGLLN